jgi:hypothetical protein
MRYAGCLSVVVLHWWRHARPKRSRRGSKPSIEALMKKIDALQRRLTRWKVVNGPPSRLPGGRIAPHQRLLQPLLRRCRSLQCSR